MFVCVILYIKVPNALQIEFLADLLGISFGTASEAPAPKSMLYYKVVFCAVPTSVTGISCDVNVIVPSSRALQRTIFKV